MRRSKHQNCQTVKLADPISTIAIVRRNFVKHSASRIGFVELCMNIV